jgi:hypothetical protein
MGLPDTSANDGRSRLCESNGPGGRPRKETYHRPLDMFPVKRDKQKRAAGYDRIAAVCGEAVYAAQFLARVAAIVPEPDSALQVR